MSGLRIADVARRSGFTPATLRYYEEIGLLPAPVRTAGGYRSYDDDTLARLAFIARAKQLGCTLEEISDLTLAWDGGRCGPVQDRLRRLVAEKQAGAQARIAELIALSAELQHAASGLERHRPEGPCDDRCGCTSDPPTTATSVALMAKPLREGDVPIACSLSADGMADRLEDWQGVLGFVRARTQLEDGVRLKLEPGAPLPEIARLAAAEQDCCRFFAFALTVDRRGLALEVRTSDDALPVLHALFGVAA
jgi:MerR family copper efflux transcriptional regulator